MEERTNRAQLAEMRAEFDGGFVLPKQLTTVASRTFVLVVAADRSLALPLPTLAGVVPFGAVLAVPSRSQPACLGVTTVRGRLHALFCLGALCGAAQADGGRWILLPRRRDGVALLVSRVVGLEHIALADTVQATKSGQEIVRARGELWDVVEPDALLGGVPGSAKVAQSRGGRR